jgi:hypothetical protein
VADAIVGAVGATNALSTNVLHHRVLDVYGRFVTAEVVCSAET